MMAVMVGISDGSTFVGRDAALADIHRDHYRSLVRLACLLVDDVGSGEEVVQDAFVRVYRAWARVDDPLKYLRTPGADDAVVVRSEHAEVLDALRALPRRQRECLVLRYYADLSKVEIASTLGISTGSVKSHAHRGHRRAHARAEGGLVNDDELRAILKSEAERVDVGDDSWSRLESRWAVASARSAPRAFALGAVAIGVVVALVVGVIWIGRTDHDANVAPDTRSKVQSRAPTRILAMTTDHRPIVISARSGTRLRSYKGDLYAEGTSIAVSPDGRDFYDVEGDGNEGCGAHIAFRRGLTRANRDYPLADEASEPAISPDGRTLAFLRCLPGDDRPDELVVRNLGSGRERTWKAPLSAFLGETVVFDGDSRHVVVSLFNPLLPAPQQSLLTRVDSSVNGARSRTPP